LSVPKDSGTYFVDQNACRAALYPFEPVFQAVSATPACTIDFADIDLVTNRNSLRNLLNFASGEVYENFRIDLDIIQSTLFLTRHEESTDELVQGTFSQGYGRNFEKYCTAHEEGLAESTGYR